jgi:AAA domain-containing protein
MSTRTATATPNEPTRPALHLATTADAAQVLSPAGPTARRAPARLRTAWTATDLIAATFPDPRWAVPGIICEGVNLLAGPPKVGKSWMSLDLGLSVATGGHAFGTIKVNPGPVLYLALEDTARRLQSRIRKILTGKATTAGAVPDGLDGLHLVTTCPPITQGGDEAIAAWLDAHPSTRLVVIDVFAKVRGSAPAGASAYDADYFAVGRIKKLADHYGVAIVLVHHVRKQSHEDFLSEVSGTNGIAGAADATIVLKRARGQADGMLHVTGRDVDEREYALTFDAHRGTWRMLDGPADEHTRGGTRAAITTYLRQHPGSTPARIAEATGANPATVRQTCARMLADAQLTCDPANRYTLTGGTGVTPVTTVTQPSLTWENSDDQA